MSSDYRLELTDFKSYDGMCLLTQRCAEAPLEAQQKQHMESIGITSVIVESVVRTVQSLEATLERMDLTKVEKACSGKPCISLIFCCFNWKE